MSQPSPPSAPNFAQQYKQGLDIYLKNLPKELQMEQGYRSTIDPQRIQAQQALQALYGPTQYSQQLAALQQLDPYGALLRSTLGGSIASDISRGYLDPAQAALYSSIIGQAGKFDAGKTALYKDILANANASNAQKSAAYNLLGQNVTSDLARRTALDPQFQRELEQSVRGAETARGGGYGNAAISAEALYKGQRAQQLYQQRLNNASGFYGLQSPEQQKLQQQLAAYGQLSPEQQQLQQMAGAYGLRTPKEGAYAQTGSFLSLPTPEAQIGAIQGVSPDRSFAYVNPNAGYQGAQYGLQNYQNQLAQYQLGGASNPWAGALGTLGGIAGNVVGGIYGGPVGSAAGGYTGGLAGNYLGSLFSDRRVKTEVKKVGNVPLYEYRYKDEMGIPGKYRSLMAQDAEKFNPENVTEFHGIKMIKNPALNAYHRRIG